MRISSLSRAPARLACVAAGFLLLTAWPAAAESLDPKTTWAVVAGVLEWRDPGLGSFPKEHRKDRELFEQLGEIGVPASQRILLLDDEATAGAVNRAVEKLVAQAGEGSTLIFYFAGHGVRDDDGRIVFTTSDTNLTQLDRTGLDLGELRRRLAPFRGKRLVLLADCCHSGGLGKVAEALASAARETVALTSAEASNVSTGNWTFTQTLIDGLGGRALFDLDADGALSFGELQSEVGEAMSHRERQRYGFVSFGVAPDLVLAKARPAAQAPAAGKNEALGPRSWVKTKDEEVGRVVGLDRAGAGGRALVEFFDYSDQRQVWLPLAALEKDELETWPAGSELRVTWSGRAWDAKVRRVDAGFMLITYPGFDASWDEWIAADRVVGPRRQKAPAAGDRVRVEWQGRWYDAQVKSAQDGQWCITYTGFDASWDECVPETRIRF